MDSSIRSILWQRRAPDQHPVLIKHGLEEGYAGSVAELIGRTSSVTLISRDGAEVQVGVRKPIGPDSWEGEILRIAPTSSGLSVGATVSFEASDVQGGTL